MGLEPTTPGLGSSGLAYVKDYLHRSQRYHRSAADNHSADTEEVPPGERSTLAWARGRGPRRVVVEADRPREERERPPAPLVSQGPRTMARPRVRPTFDDLLRGGRSRGRWERE